MATHDTRTALEVFSYSGHDVRTVMIGGDPWFVAADICAVLGHSNPTAAVARLDDDERGLRIVETPSGPQQMLITSEPGLYALIGRSRKPAAKAFDRWVRHDVLPQIRRTGAYVGPAAAPAPALPASYAEALRALAAEVEAKEAVTRALEVAAPKADAWASMVAGGGDLSLTAAAKALQSSGARIRTREFLLYLHEKRWIYRAGGVGDWQPYAEVLTSGLMTTRLVSDHDGRTKPQARVTMLGMEKARAMLVDERGAESSQTSLKLVVS